MEKKKFIIQAGSRTIDKNDTYLNYYKGLDYDAGDRWNNYLGVKKHMIPIKGEPLIHRTQRILLENGATNVVVKCNKEDIDKYVIDGAVGIENPEIKHFYPDHEFINSMPLLNQDGVTVLLWGDTYYSENIIKNICNNTSENWHYYARRRHSEITGKVCGEPYAWYFHDHHITDMLKSAEKSALITSQLIAEEGGNNPVANYGWKMEDTSKMTYRIMSNLDPEDPHEVESFHWIEWNDETEDFDYPEHWDNWSKRLPHLAY